MIYKDRLTNPNSIIKVELPRQKVLIFTELFFNVYLKKSNTRSMSLSLNSWCIGKQMTLSAIL